MYQNIAKICQNRNVFSSNTFQWHLSMGNQVAAKADFPRLCFSLLVLCFSLRVKPFLLKKIKTSLNSCVCLITF